MCVKHRPHNAQHDCTSPPHMPSQTLPIVWCIGPFGVQSLGLAWGGIKDWVGADGTMSLSKFINLKSKDPEFHKLLAAHDVGDHDL